MRRAVTFAVTGDYWELIIGPDVPLKEHIAALKGKAASGDFGGADALEIWTSSGRIKRVKAKGVQQPSEKSSESENLEKDFEDFQEQEKSKSKKR